MLSVSWHLHLYFCTYVLTLIREYKLLKCWVFHDTYICTSVLTPCFYGQEISRLNLPQFWICCKFMFSKIENFMSFPTSCSQQRCASCCASLSRLNLSQPIFHHLTKSLNCQNFMSLTPLDKESKFLIFFWKFHVTSNFYVLSSSILWFF